MLHNNKSWLEGQELLTVLQATRIAVFEFNPRTGEQSVSPMIRETLAGNYDGRMLSDVMIEDDVIFPDDIEQAMRFRREFIRGEAAEMTIRLKTRNLGYHWHKMYLMPFMKGDEQFYIGVLSDVDQEMRQMESLRYQAEYDIVTGISNQETFLISTARQMSIEPNRGYCLVRMDIHRFKLINALYTNAVGDRVLRYFADILRDIIGPGETYARLGNDVFCMCLARTTQATVQVINEIESRLSDYPIEFYFMLSAGVLHVKQYHGEAISILCDHAALAQRTVKGNYVKRYAFYNDSMRAALNRENQLTDWMQYALESNQFLLYLQPKYDMRNHTIIGAEALARWKHPVGGMISTGEFIPLFERNGFILRLDEYIWECACRAIRSWIDQGITVIPISVNVSRTHLYDIGFCDKIRSLVKKYDIAPELLELEITESAYTENTQMLYEIMDKLQNDGFIFSMDDFGSGYSSLNALKDIPVNIIKIDLNFLKESRRGEKTSRDILKGVIQMVRGMDLPIIAEGVETEEQSEFLLSVGCNNAQGYFYARPMPLESFELLRQET